MAPYIDEDKVISIYDNWLLAMKANMGEWVCTHHFRESSYLEFRDKTYQGNSNYAYLWIKAGFVKSGIGDTPMWQYEFASFEEAWREVFPKLGINYDFQALTGVIDNR